MVWKIYLHMKIWLFGGMLNFLGQFLNPLGKNTTFKWLGLFPATGGHSSNLKIDWWNFWAIDCRSLTGWWLNQPIWKLCSSKWVHLPQILGWKYKTYFKPPPSYKSLNLSAKKWGYRIPGFQSDTLNHPLWVSCTVSATEVCGGLVAINSL